MCNCGSGNRRAVTPNQQAAVPSQVPNQTQGTNQILVYQQQQAGEVAQSIQKQMIARRKNGLPAR